MSHSSRFTGMAWIAMVALTASGCIVEQSPPPPPPDTEIAFGEVMNFHEQCSTLTSWQVTMRETGTVLVGSCADSVYFTGLVPNATYTFDLVGYAGGSRVCWQGSCSVPTAGGIQTWGDCSAQMQPLCGF